MRATKAILAVLLASVVAPVAAADAATVDPLNPCYRSVSKDAREKVAVHGHGFTPGVDVAVSVDGAQPINATADENGDVTGMVTAPFQRRGERPFAITLAEQGLPANTVTVQSRIAALAVRLKPAHASPARIVRFIGRGFIDGDGIYGHYLRGGKLRRTVLLGRPQGACGSFDERHRQIPIRRAHTGQWTLQVDNQPVYTPQPATPFVRLSIIVERIVVNPSEVLP